MADAGDADPLSVAPGGTSMTMAELAAATGLEEDDLRELERFGLITGRPVASAVYYDEDALQVTNLAVGFMKYGVEARHLRMYKTAADREASFLEQVVMPMLKQRNPRARRQASETLSELARLGQGLRAAMLRQALREYLEAP
jgi:DNA-binding transcriptional MerR regulator